MSALPGINSVNLPHVNIWKWAAKKGVFLPLDFRATRAEEAVFLKYLSIKPYFVKLPPAEEAARFREGMKEFMKYIPSDKIKDKTVILIQVAGAVIIAVVYVAQIANSKL